MSEVMTVQVFIAAVSLLGPLLGSFILCRKYRKICDTYTFDEAKAKLFHSRVITYQMMVMSCFIYGLLEALMLGKKYGVVPYTAAAAGLLACFLNCVAGVVQGLTSARFINAETVTSTTEFNRGIRRMGLIELIPAIGFILYIVSWKI